MRKAVIIIAIGITLIITGGIVTAMELSTWTPYDLEQNVANFDIETLTTKITFEELGSEKLIVSNERWIDFDYEDYLEGFEDYLDIDSDFDYPFNNSRPYQGVHVSMDGKQTVGTVKIEYTYAVAFDNEQCGIDSITFGKGDSRVEYRSHIEGRGNMRNTRGTRQSKRQSSRFREENTTYLFPQCYGVNSWGFGYSSKNSLIGFRFTEELKQILKHKQVPVRMSEITITINPSDSDKVINR